jgi:hypothetical protein
MIVVVVARAVVMRMLLLAAVPLSFVPASALFSGRRG